MEHAEGPKGNPEAAISAFFNEAYTSLASPVLWIGVAAGVAMIAGAIWLRRWREEN
jgi:ABC-2 type transport system permease protein